MHVKARPTREFLHDAYVKIYTSSRPTMAPEKKKRFGVAKCKFRRFSGR